MIKEVHQTHWEDKSLIEVFSLEWEAELGFLLNGVTWRRSSSYPSSFRSYSSSWKQKISTKEAVQRGRRRKGSILLLCLAGRILRTFCRKNGLFANTAWLHGCMMFKPFIKLFVCLLFLLPGLIEMFSSCANKFPLLITKRFSSQTVNHLGGKIERFEVVPLTLYRIQAKLPVRLRSYDKQMASGRKSYDLKLTNGLVLPAEGDVFTGPNGMSMRPASDYFKDICRNFSGSPTVYTLVSGLVLPQKLILLHEHTDHYSLQAREPMPLAELNDILTSFLKALPFQTRDQFVAK